MEAKAFGLVHEIVCVECDAREYVRAEGKSQRRMKGICPSCMEKADGVSKKKEDDSPAKSSSVPKR